MQTGNETSQFSPRDPRIAMLMSACPGLGQMYAGYLVRGIALYFTLIILSWLAAIAFMYVENRILSILLLSVPFVGVALIAVDAFLCAKKQTKDYRLARFNQPAAYAGVFLLLLVTVNPLMDFFIGKNVVRAFYVTSKGMSPTVQVNDILVINKLVMPKKGDIALVEFSKSSGKTAQLTNIMDDQMVSRVIAGPGDTLEIRDNDVFVNGEKLVEPYAHYSDKMNTMGVSDEMNKFGPKPIPPDSYFVLGDNRSFSMDSRVFGFIEKGRIGGKVTKVFWSWSLDQGSIQWDRTAKALK